MALTFHYAARSDVGLVRKDNQDSGYAGPHLLVVADGMGGHAGGDLASATVITELVEIAGDEPFILHPGEFVLASTFEQVTLGDDVAARLPLERVGAAVGVAGTVTTVTAEALGLAEYDPAVLHGAELSVAEVRAAADRLVAAGVSSILNFAATAIQVPEGVHMRKVDLSTELQILAFHEQRKAGLAGVAP